MYWLSRRRARRHTATPILCPNLKNEQEKHLKFYQWNTLILLFGGSADEKFILIMFIMDLDYGCVILLITNMKQIIVQ